MPPSPPSKRAPSDDSSSSEDETGPSLPSAGANPRKKRRTLAHERLYLSSLPSSPRYQKSYMHKDNLAFVTFTPSTDFLITAGAQGQVSFWKKDAEPGSISFVKEFRAHDASTALLGATTSWDGRLYATVGSDDTVKIWDVLDFDLVAVLHLPEPARTLAYVHSRGADRALLAVGYASGGVALFDGRGETPTELHRVARGRLHRAPVSAIAFSPFHGVAVSADEAGGLEYWTPSEAGTLPGSFWSTKALTSLFALKKSKSAAYALAVSPDGKYLAASSAPDRAVRVFEFASGRLLRTYDESVATLEAMQQAGTSATPLEPAEFARRLAAEHELDATQHARASLVFDESSKFLFYGALGGIKVVNVVTSRVVRTYAAAEAFRPLGLALYQGAPDAKRLVTVEMAASANPLLAAAEARDALLVATGVAKSRFYIFGDDAGADARHRDVQNEKPRVLGKDAAKKQKDAADSATGAVLHTTLGDIGVRLFPEAAPKTVQNFVGLARKGYYNGVIFHRVIRKFMIQTGDPLGDGTGGESIWGGEFEDEIVDSLKHDRAYTLSMANAGPNTNASQFFITTEKTPWLDGKHTIFGRAVKGLDVVHRIENVRTFKEKPDVDIRIVSIDVS